MENFGKSFTLLHNIRYYKDIILEAIFYQFGNDNGNQIKLLITLLASDGCGKFDVTEKYIKQKCNFLNEEYCEAVQSLISLGWLHLNKNNIILDVEKILDMYNFPEANLKDIDGYTINYIKNFLNPYKKSNCFIKKDIFENEKVDWEEIKTYIKNMVYSDFLKTDYWKCVSKEKKAISNNKCQMCGSTKKLNVHHNTYIHHGEEHKYINSDLICLCNTCHSKFHNIGGEVND